MLLCCLLEVFNSICFGECNKLCDRVLICVWLSVVENNNVWCNWWLVSLLIILIWLVKFKFRIWLVLLKIKSFKFESCNECWFKWLVKCFGVFIIKWGFLCSVLIWLLKFLLLSILMVLIFVLVINSFNWLYIWVVNLWVGVMIKMWGLCLLSVFCFIICCIVGNKNVSVLFDFVFDCVKILWFVIVVGIVWVWMLVGWVMFWCVSCFLRCVLILSLVKCNV